MQTRALKRSLFCQSESMIEDEEVRNVKKDWVQPKYTNTEIMGWYKEIHTAQM